MHAFTATQFGHSHAMSHGICLGGVFRGAGREPFTQSHPQVCVGQQKCHGTIYALCILRIASRPTLLNVS